MTRKTTVTTQLAGLPDDTRKGPEISRQRPRIGIIVASLGKYNSKALRYAILRLNTAQSFVEYEIVYDVPFEHEFVTRTRSGAILQKLYIEEITTSFEEEILRRQSLPFKGNPQKPCNRYLALCNCQLDSYIYLSKPGKKIRTLMVGGWNAHFAPPSLLEFIVDICIKEGIRQAFSSPASHMSSRGCIFDYNETLDNTRNGVLIGHVCDECTAHMTSHNSNLDEIKKLIGGRWLGDPSDPFSAYCELQRLGFRAFKASGVRDSLFRRILDTIPLQFVGKLVESVALGLALYVSLLLGLKK